MKITSRCIPCILEVRSREILNAETLSEEEKKEKLRGLIKLVHELLTPEASTIYVASEAFRYVKTAIGDPDPYKRLKDESNRIALKLLPQVEKRVSKLEGFEKFKTLVTVSVNANIIDVGVSGLKYDLGKLGEVLFKDSFAIDHRLVIYEKLIKSSKIVFLLDNAGEAVFDKLLVKYITEDLGKKVTVITKSCPYQNDVTFREALELGFNEVADVLGTGSDYAGLFYGTYTREVSKVIKESDLVISKGMANYEALHYKPLEKTTAFLLKAKCDPVARTLNTVKGSNIAFLRPLRTPS